MSDPSKVHGPFGRTFSGLAAVAFGWACWEALPILWATDGGVSLALFAGSAFARTVFVHTAIVFTGEAP